MEKKHEFIDKVIEAGIYLYIVFMFLTKGEGLRNVLIFGNFSLWLLILKYRKNLYLLKEPVSILCWIFVGATLFSVIFSIDPLYSFLELRGEPIKFILLFSVITTVMADEVKLKRAVYVCFFTALLIVIIGYYSYIFLDIPMLKPYTPLMHTGHSGSNRFARYLNTLLPFSFILLFLLKKTGNKALFISLLTISIIALILSGSRGGYIAFFIIVFVWALYLSQIRRYNFKRVIVFLVLILFIFGALSWFYSPYGREKISNLSKQISTVNLRTEAWGPALDAIKKRPFFGWGYGYRIYYLDEPYRDTPYKIAPPKGSHNMFIKVLFHQGIVGIIPYVSLIIFSAVIFWREALKTSGIKSYILIACVSVIAGNFIFHAMLENTPRLHYLAVVLGMGMAARGIDENSHN